LHLNLLDTYFQFEPRIVLQGARSCGLKQIFRAPLNIHFLLRPAAKAAYFVALGGHIAADMPFSRALSATFSLGLATKLNN
jgi:hypothetical protein